MHSEAGHLYVPALPYLRRIFCLNAAEHYSAVESWQQLISMGEQVTDEMLDAIASEVYSIDDLMIIYTSGTTANPKGVLHVHRAACIQFWRWVEQMRLTSADRVWNVYPFFWTAGFSMSLGGTLAAGGCLILQEAFDAEKTLKLIESEHVTTLYAWPHQDAALSEHPDARKRDLSSLRNISNTFVPTKSRTIRRCRRSFMSPRAAAHAGPFTLASLWTEYASPAPLVHGLAAAWVAVPPRCPG
jgi:fatty-acyl-CoA synthase